MSTRAVIARQVSDGFKGRYHHFDGYPTGLGKTLFDLHQGHFKGDTVKMVKALIDAHKAGWSTIDGDWSIKPGYTTNDYKLAEDDPRRRRPHCYCHGDRHQEEYTITDQEVQGDIEYIYVINESKHLMTITSPHTDMCVTVKLGGQEPNWQAIEDEIG